MNVIGLMSGTSGDGIDVALCEIEGAPPQLSARIVNAFTKPYTPDQQQRILAACQPEHGTVDVIARLNVELGELFASAILDLLAKSGLRLEHIDLIGSHGQTVWHQIAADGTAEATLQIGEASVIAERTGITTINNFRARDIAAGGQGAPLTSYVDWLLLRHPTKWRAIQNIGGMGNVSLLPPLSDSESAMVAFDTGPGNALIDVAVHQLTGNAFDRDGELAAQGEIDELWLDELLQDPFFKRNPPKTTGRERFGTEMARQFVTYGLNRGLTPADIVATLTMLTAESIRSAYENFSPSPIGEVILGGGGQRNSTLVAMLRGLLDPVTVNSHETYGISSDFKEALVFAVLAYESWHNRPSTLKQQTGASHPSVLGQITPGSNYEMLGTHLVGWQEIEAELYN